MPYRDHKEVSVNAFPESTEFATFQLVHVSIHTKISHFRHTEGHWRGREENFDRTPWGISHYPSATSLFCLRVNARRQIEDFADNQTVIPHEAVTPA